MSATHFDVIIVGARCSGPTLAVYLARAGASVLLLEKDRLGSDYIVSTHTIHPPGIEVLDEIGVGSRMREVTPPARVIRLRKGATCLDLSFPDGHADYCPRRQRLDSLMQQAAIEAGAEVLDRTRVTGLIRDGNRVTGVEAERDGQTQRFRADIVVGADGRHSFVAGQVGAKEYFAYDAPRAMYWAYWNAPDHWQTDPEYACDFYLGHPDQNTRVIFQTDEDQLLIGTLPPVEEAKRWRSDLSRAYRENLEEDDFVAGVIENSQPESKIRGTVSERYFFREAAGPGWALVGDAGHHKEFILGDGMTEAMLQARSLAGAIRQGSDAALQSWRRERDAKAWELYCFGKDEGALERPIALQEAVLEGVARDQRLKDSMALVFERRVSPYDALPVSAVLKGLGRAISRGKWRTIPQFLKQGKRIGAVKRELKALQKRAAAISQSGKPGPAFEATES